MEQIIKELLEKNGWEYAKKYIIEKQDKMIKYGIETQLIVPHCLYEKNNQCDLFCPYFDKICTYKGES